MNNDKIAVMKYFAITEKDISLDSLNWDISAEDNLDLLEQKRYEIEIKKKLSGKKIDKDLKQNSKYLKIVEYLMDALASIERNRRQITSAADSKNSKRTRRPNAEQLAVLISSAPYVESASDIDYLPKRNRGSVYPIYFKIKVDQGSYRKNHIWFSAFLAIFSKDNSIKSLEKIFLKWQKTEALADKKNGKLLLQFKEFANNEFDNIESILSDFRADLDSYQYRLYSMAKFPGFDLGVASFFLALMGDTMSPSLDEQSWSCLIDNGVVKEIPLVEYKNAESPYFGEVATWTSVDEMRSLELRFIKLENKFKHFKKEVAKKAKKIGITSIEDDDVFRAYPDFAQKYMTFKELIRRKKSDNKLILAKLSRDHSITSRVGNASARNRFEESDDLKKIRKYVEKQFDGWDGDVDTFWEWYSERCDAGNISVKEKYIINSKLFKSLFPELFVDNSNLRLRQDLDALGAIDDQPEQQKNISVSDFKWYIKAFGENNQLVKKYFKKFAINLKIPSLYSETIDDINKKCSAVGLRAFVVGGFVRDLIIGKNAPKDLDIVVDVIDQQKYFNTINPILENIKKNPLKFIQSQMSGAKEVRYIDNFNIKQSNNRKEFFRISATISYIDKSGKKQKLVKNVPFESSINPSYILASLFGSIIPRGEAFGIYAIKTPVGEIEIAYPRTERYKSGSRKPMTEMGTIDEDARRRDFAINALYLDLQNKEINDPTGRGLDDIKNHIISITDPNAIDIIFNQDPLRILRAFRFLCRFNESNCNCEKCGGNLNECI